MATSQNDTSLPAWAYVLLGCVAAAIGLASSGITAQFFVLGLQKIEEDAMARDLLIATGALMIVTELAAFGVAALLPVRQLRALRYKLIVCGAMLLTFEATTIYVTTVALAQTSDAAATASNMRVADLRTSIDQRRQAAKSLRENGALQSTSSNAWTRTLGANALRDSLKVEQAIEPLSAELMQLQRDTKPAMSSVLGAQGMLWYSMARAMLISAMGLFMFGAAGALLREARGQRKTSASHPSDTDTQGSATAVPPLPVFVYTIPSLAAPKIASSGYAANVIQLKSERPQTTSVQEQAQPKPPIATTTPMPSSAAVASAPPSSPSNSGPTHLPRKPISRIAALMAEGWCRKIPSNPAGGLLQPFLRSA